MIEYEFVYNKGSRPEILKKFTAKSGEVFSMPFGFENEFERSSLTSEQIYTHLENILQYTKDTGQNLSLVYPNEPTSTDGWHLKGGSGEIQWANEESLRWWEYVYYRPEDDELIVEQPLEEQPAQGETT